MPGNKYSEEIALISKKFTFLQLKWWISIVILEKLHFSYKWQLTDFKKRLDLCLELI